MPIVVQPAELRDRAAQIRADAALLESLLLVARLEAAAAAVPGTETAAAARLAAEALRTALAQVRQQIAACGAQLVAAADTYEHVDGAVLRGSR